MYIWQKPRCQRWVQKRYLIDLDRGSLLLGFEISKKTKNLGMIGLEVLFSIQMFIFQNLSCAHYEMVVPKNQGVDFSI